MKIECPCCKADNREMTCRRCKADLGLLHSVHEWEQNELTHIQSCIVSGQLALADEQLQKCLAVRASPTALQLMALSALLSADYPRALQAYLAYHSALPPDAAAR